MIKLLRILVLLSVLAAPALAANATFTATFDQPNGVDPSLEYVVEVKLPDGTFVEVAKGSSSPIVYTANAAWGAYVVRYFTRSLPVASFVRNPAVDTSSETSTTLVPGKPTNPKITSNRSAVEPAAARTTRTTAAPK